MLTDRFNDALVYAAKVHATQTRKRTRIPYVSHLMSVTGLVLEHGGDEDQAIAALLHDAVEDQGGEAQLAEIRTRYGDRVADMVWACTDGLDGEKGPWRERKEAYLTHLKSVPDEVRLISCADKLHNLQSILKDYRIHGEALWDRFNGGKEGTLWYYEALHEHYHAFGPKDMARLLADAIVLLKEEMRSTTLSDYFK